MESNIFQSILNSSYVHDLITAGGAIVGILLKLRYDSNIRKKEALKQDQLSKDMNKDYEHKLRIVPILERIRYELKADRVLQCSFSNGDITFTGYHMKKISITEEVKAEGLETIAPNFQLIPTKVFERNLDKLYHAESDYIITDESQYKDELSILNLSYGLHTLLLIKLRDTAGKWIGVLTVSYPATREISTDDVVFAKTQASSI